MCLTIFLISSSIFSETVSERHFCASGCDFCSFGGPVWANLGDIWGCIFKVSFDKQFGGVKTQSGGTTEAVPGGPGPHQEALS